MLRLRITAAAVCAAVAPAAADDAPKPSPFQARVAANFAAWDHDKNGELSKAEIDRAVTDPSVKGEDAAAAAAIKRAMRSKTRTLPPLTKDSLERLAAPPADKKSAATNFDALYESSLARITASPRTLCPSGRPSLDKIHQGKSGDCFCLAPLGALVHRDPKSVTDMIRPTADGGFEVTFGTGPPVVVPAPTDAEIALTGSTEQDGIWVNVYEKAVGTYLARQRKLDALAVDVVSRGGSAGSMVEVVTGHAITRISCSPLKSADTPAADREKLLTELRGRLTATRAARKLVCGGTASSGGKKVPGVTWNHAYAILGYDQAADAVTLWNPHGQTFAPAGKPGLEHGYPTADGKFTVPLTELVTFFGGFSFETDEPAK